MAVYSWCFPSLYFLDRYWKLFLSDFGRKKEHEISEILKVRWGSWYQNIGQKFSYIIAGWNHAEKHQNNVSIGLLGIWILTVFVIKITSACSQWLFKYSTRVQKSFLLPWWSLLASFPSVNKEYHAFHPKVGLWRNIIIRGGWQLILILNFLLRSSSSIPTTNKIFLWFSPHNKPQGQECATYHTFPTMWLTIKLVAKQEKYHKMVIVNCKHQWASCIWWWKALLVIPLVAQLIGGNENMIRVRSLVN